MISKTLYGAAELARAINVEQAMQHKEPKVPLSIATDEAVQMLEAGWTVRYLDAADQIEWRSPKGISGYDYLSESLDSPPEIAVRAARLCGHIVNRPRVAGQKELF